MYSTKLHCFKSKESCRQRFYLLLLTLFSIISLHEGEALYFSQPGANLTFVYWPDNSLPFHFANVLFEPGESGLIKYKYSTIIKNNNSTNNSDNNNNNNNKNKNKNNRRKRKEDEAKEEENWITAEENPIFKLIESESEGRRGVFVFTDPNFKPDIRDTIHLKIVAEFNKVKAESVILIVTKRKKAQEAKICPSTKEELCFGGLSRLKLQVLENENKPLLGAQLGVQSKLCPKYESNLIPNIEEGIYMRKNVNSSTWEIWFHPRLDRESVVGVIAFNLTCHLYRENSKNSEEAIIQGSLQILDQDDNAPIRKVGEASRGRIMLSFFGQKNKFEVKSRLIPDDKEVAEIHDHDSIDVNKYKVVTVNDTLGILDLDIVSFPNDYWTTRPQTTVSVLKISLSEKVKDTDSWKGLYCVEAYFNDTSMVGNPSVTQIIYDICLHWESEPSDTHSETESSFPSSASETQISEQDCMLIEENGLYNARLQRTATPFTRVLSPFPELIMDKSEFADGYNFSFRIESFQIETTLDYDGEGGFGNPFRVTPKSGIIYITNSSIIKNEKFLHALILLTWNCPSKNNQRKANITIYFEGNSQEELSEMNCDSPRSCAEFDNEAHCESSCGTGTHKFCSWHTHTQNYTETEGDSEDFIPDVKLPNFTTCSPVKDTCPDGICDELEDLEPHLCPQDCATELNGIGKLRHWKRGTNHGIETASGICSCHNKRTCTCGQIPDKIHPSLTKIIIRNNKEFENNFQSNTDRNASPPKCGTVCSLILACTLFLAFLITAIGIIFLIKSRGKKKGTATKATFSQIEASDEFIDSLNGDLIPDYLESTNTMMSGENSIVMSSFGHPLFVNADPKWEIARENIVLQEILGEGEFGCVHKALMNVGDDGQSLMEVAVKILKGAGLTLSTWKDFSTEFSLLKQLNHPNIIKLIGACTLARNGPPYLIMEFAEFGSIRSFLRKCRHIEQVNETSSGYFLASEEIKEKYVVTAKEILGFAWQVAKGMAYLSDMKMVHRDLAGRNVLLTSGKVCKISDFGLTRDIYVDETYKKKSKDRVPVKWLAPECLIDELYTTKSDVWAYGVFLWELVNLGSSPYPGISVNELYQLLKAGHRMPKPDNCSNELYSIMRQCWHNEPANRPSFKHLITSLLTLMEDGIDYLKLEIHSVSNPGYEYT